MSEPFLSNRTTTPHANLAVTTMNNCRYSRLGLHARKISVPFLLAAICGCISVTMRESASGPPEFEVSRGIYDKVVSHERVNWGGFELDQIYKTMCDLVMVEDIHGIGLTLQKDDPQIAGHGALFYTAPATIDEYRADPLLWPTIVGVIEQGTRVRVEEVRTHGTHNPFVNAFVGGSRFYYVRARILDGPFRDILVELTNFTEYETQSRGNDEVFLHPDVRFLKVTVESSADAE